MGHGWQVRSTDGTRGLEGGRRDWEVPSQLRLYPSTEVTA